MKIFRVIAVGLMLAAPVQAQDYDVGLAAAQAGDFATALQNFRPLAEQGDANAQNTLGLMYHGGDGVPQDDAEAVRRIALALDGPVVAALARCAPGDIDRAAWSIAPAKRGRIHTFIATSDLHLAKKLNMSRQQGLAAAVAAVSTIGVHDDFSAG